VTDIVFFEIYILAWNNRDEYRGLTYCNVVTIALLKSLIFHLLITRLHCLCTLLNVKNLYYTFKIYTNNILLTLERVFWRLYECLFFSAKRSKSLQKNLGQTKSASTKVNFTNILHAAFCQFLFAKKLQIQTVSLEIMQVTLLYKKSFSSKFGEIGTLSHDDRWRHFWRVKTKMNLKTQKFFTFDWQFFGNIKDNPIIKI